MTWVAGVDACKGGWIAAFRNLHTGALTVRVEKSFANILAAAEQPVVVAVDIPIGLPSAAEPGGRACDAEARVLLTKVRASSVFPCPVRAVLAANSYTEALAFQRASSVHSIGLSKQAWAIVPKITDVDQHMTPALQQRVIEIHPELCFHEMAGKAMSVKKSDSAGQEERIHQLELHGFADLRSKLPGFARPGAKTDDILDSLAALWTAERHSAGRSKQLPTIPPLDSRGLRMEMWR